MSVKWNGQLVLLFALYCQLDGRLGLLLPFDGRLGQFDTFSGVLDGWLDLLHDRFS